MISYISRPDPQSSREVVAKGLKDERTTRGTLSKIIKTRLSCKKVKNVNNVPLLVFRPPFGILPWRIQNRSPQRKKMVVFFEPDPSSWVSLRR